MPDRPMPDRPIAPAMAARLQQPAPLLIFVSRSPTSTTAIKSIRVHILGREYALRVRDEDEAHTREMAAFVNRRMRSFKSAHPEQAELTTAIITALALADELHQVRDSTSADTEHVTRELNRLADTLASAVAVPDGQEA